MATLIELHGLAVGSPLLEKRFLAARLVAAWNILNESTGTTFHTERLAWATKVIETYDGDCKKEFRRFMSNPSIQTTLDSSTDGDVQFTVNSFINTFAGV